MEKNNELYHFNKNHDRLGRFASSRSGGHHDSKALTKIKAGEKEKSNHRRELERKYREQGMNYRQAEKAADDRIRAEKIVAGVGIATVAAAATAYGAYKYKEYTEDTLLPKSTALQRVVVGGQKDHHLNDRNFYAAYKPKDKIKYGRYAGQLNSQSGNVWAKGDGVDYLSIRREGGLKIASEKTARNEFAKLWKSNPEFRDAVRSGAEAGQKNLHGGGNPQQRAAYRTLFRKGALSDKQIKGKAYDAFNINIVADHGEHSEKAFNMLSDELKKKGIGAINDVNDMKYSGFKATRPIIVFKDSQAKYSVSSKRVTDAAVKGRAALGTGLITFDQAIPYMAIGGAASAASSVASRQYIINEYKKDHPNTRLTNSQIVERYRGV